MTSLFLFTNICENNLRKVLYMKTVLLHLYHTKQINKMNTSVTVSRKKSGNFIAASHVESAWDVLFEAKTPLELHNYVTKLSGQIIVASYSQAQKKEWCFNFSKKTALRLFGLPVTKNNLQLYF